MFKKTVAIACVSGMLIVANMPLLNAFEAHVVNVRATMCNYSEIRSTGFWKTYIEDEVFQPYQIQLLGDEEVGTAGEALIILNQNATMESKLKAQLLAMKFNIAYYNVGNYLDETEEKTLNEIAAEADILLQDSDAEDEEREIMKDLLEYWNTQETLKYCYGVSIPIEPVIVEEEVVVINKVYTNPDIEHGCSSDEWLEIFNSGTVDVNLKDWQICDNATCDFLSLNDLILEVGQYAVIAPYTTVWNSWDVPEGTLKIVLGSAIGNMLNNDIDMLALKNSAGEIVDQLNWGGIPGSGWANYNIDLWAPGVSAPDEGYILGRISNGYDTDQLYDWTIYELPSVQVTYPNGGETFYVGRTHYVEWIALDNNDSDSSDLSIDIWYSADSGATWANIDRGIENSGRYDFVVPLCLDNGSGECYWTPSNKSRIKVVATDNARNFMLTGWDMSDEDFCPPIDFSLITPEEAAMLAQLGITENSLIEDIYAQGAAASEINLDDIVLEENIIEDGAGDQEVPEEDGEVQIEVSSSDTSTSSGEEPDSNTDGENELIAEDDEDGTVLDGDADDSDDASGSDPDEDDDSTNGDLDEEDINKEDEDGSVSAEDTKEQDDDDLKSDVEDDQKEEDISTEESVIDDVEEETIEEEQLQQQEELGDREEVTQQEITEDGGDIQIEFSL
ncbi:MAG: lamin tail domain-containing protein [Candidatus Pacebacteria bacterium]|nr:lamin tail domain-containing protein [Candidatus Paceibacterota bacterium]